MTFVLLMLLTVSPAISRDLADGEFERALKKIDAALKKTTDGGEIARLQLARAQAFIALNELDKARAAFALALAADPAVEPHAQHTSPDALRLFEKVRAELPARLVVEVKGGRADIRVGERELGPAPLRAELPAGDVVVEARGAEGQVVRREVRLEPGRELRLALELDSGLKTPSPETAPELAPPTAVAGVTAPLPQRTSRRLLGLGPLIGGAVVGVAGSVLLGLAFTQQQRLVNPAMPALNLTEQKATVRDGALFQTLGWAGIAVGATAIVTGALLLVLLNGDVEASVSAAASSSGAWVTLSGRWP